MSEGNSEYRGDQQSEAALLDPSLEPYKIILSSLSRKSGQSSRVNR